MKKLVFDLLTTAILFTACGGDPQPAPPTPAAPETQVAAAPSNPPSPSLERDTVKENTIKKYMNELDEMTKSGNREELKFNFSGGQDAMVVTYDKDKNIAKAIVSLMPKDAEIRKYCYFKNGKLVFYKHREWYKTGNPGTKEVNFFADENGIFYLNERSMKLQEGEHPTAIMGSPFIMSRMNRDSLMMAVSREWDLIRSAAGK